MEMLILVLILADVVLVTIEAGVDDHLFCIGGKEVGVEQVNQPVHLANFGPADDFAHNEIPKISLLSSSSVLHSASSPSSFLSASIPTVQSSAKMMLLSSRMGRARVSSLSNLRQRSAGKALVTQAISVGQEPDHHSHESHEGHVDHADGGHHAHESHADGGHHAHDSHAAGGHHHGHHEASTVLICETREGHESHHLMHTCHQWSIVILCIFMVELSLKWYVNPEHFMSNFYHKLDFFVVSVSLIVDTLVMWYIEENAESPDKGRKDRDSVELALTLLILCRLWRVVRIIHGLFEQYHHFSEEAEKPKVENEKLRKIMQANGLDPKAELAKAK